MQVELEEIIENWFPEQLRDYYIQNDLGTLSVTQAYELTQRYSKCPIIGFSKSADKVGQYACVLSDECRLFCDESTFPLINVQFESDSVQQKALLDSDIVDVNTRYELFNEMLHYLVRADGLSG